MIDPIVFAVDQADVGLGGFQQSFETTSRIYAGEAAAQDHDLLFGSAPISVHVCSIRREAGRSQELI